MGHPNQIASVTGNRYAAGRKAAPSLPPEEQSISSITGKTVTSATVRYTYVEAQAQLQWVHEFLSIDSRVGEYSLRQRIALPRSEGGLGVKITGGRARSLMDRVRAEWLKQGAASIKETRASAIARTHFIRKRALMKNDLKTALACEVHISDLEGTRAPIEIQIDAVLTTAASQLLSSLSVEQLTELAEEHRSAVSKAKLYDAQVLQIGDGGISEG